MSKIGVGIITCNRLDFFKNCLESVLPCSFDELVIVNDGSDTEEFRGIDKGPGVVLQNSVNLGVGKAKNRALKHLVDRGCDYIFLLEDDMLILDKTVFDKYIAASKVSGIQHFNYGPGSPFNRKQVIQNFDLHNRHLLDDSSSANPKIIIDYGGGIRCSFYEHIAGVFSFYSKSVLDIVGFMDEDYHNAWEHVDHTYRVIQEQGHPPFWWFADISDSEKAIKMQTRAIQDSETAKDKQEWFANIQKGREIYKAKHHVYPNMTPQTTKEGFVESLKLIKNRWKI